MDVISENKLRPDSVASDPCEGYRGRGFKYEPQLEEREYCRALLSPAELSQLKIEIAENGFMSIDKVREYIRQNTIKESQESRGESFMIIDPEILMVIDMRTDYPIFIAEDNVFTRDELLQKYPFDEFRKTPEEVFVQQEIGVFYSPTGSAGGEPYELSTRDLDDGNEFLRIRDLVGRATRTDYGEKRTPTRTAKTKLFLGKEGWADFIRIIQIVRSFRTFVAPLMLEAPSGDSGPARALINLFGRAPLALQEPAHPPSLSGGRDEHQDQG
jgi:hypothetical protein